MDAYEKVIEALQGYDYRVHQSGEPAYEQLKEGECLIEVLSGKEDDMIIEFANGEISLFFGNDHDHYDPSYDDEIYWLVDRIEDILSNKRCAASLYYNTDDFPRLLATAYCKAADIDKDPEEIFEFVYQLKEFKEKMENNGGKMVFRFWDPSLNKETIIEKRQKNYS